jgi:hypothetical protein
MWIQWLGREALLRKQFTILVVLYREVIFVGLYHGKQV